jgi:Fe-S-cluster containining protein
MSTIIQKEGYAYAFDADACSACGGRCCTGESGNIFVRPDEITAIASLLGMQSEPFKAAYLEKRGYRFSLREKLTGLSHDCIFFDRAFNGCQIYRARPQQCRTFPFWEYYKERIEELKIECPGIIDD